MEDSNHLTFRPIRNTDNTNKIKLGGEYASLESFIRKYAIKNHQENLTKTYVLVNDQSQVKGFISLSCSQIELCDEEKDGKLFDSGARFKYYPAIKITRLGIDKLERGKGYGTNLIKWVVNYAARYIAVYIGCRFICLDANLNSVGFYESLGFIRLEKQEKPDQHINLFYDIHKTLLAEQETAGKLDHSLIF